MVHTNFMTPCVSNCNINLILTIKLHFYRRGGIDIWPYRRETKNSPLRDSRGKPKTRAFFAFHLSLQHKIRVCFLQLSLTLFSLRSQLPFSHIVCFTFRLFSPENLLSVSVATPISFQPTKIPLTTSITPTFDSKILHNASWFFQKSSCITFRDLGKESSFWWVSLIDRRKDSNNFNASC